MVQKPILTRTIRYQTDVLINNNPVTRGDLLKMMFAISNNPVDGTTLWSGVRVTRIEMWSVDNTAMTSCAVEWQATRGPSSLVVGTGTINQPAHVNTKPPKMSEAGFWSCCSDSSTIRSEVLFYLSCPVGTIVDVHIQFVEANGSVSSTPAECLNVSVTAGIANSIAFNVLSPSVSNAFHPVDVTWYRAV